MKLICFSILIFILIAGCKENDEFDSTLRLLSLEDIKREYQIADSLNNLEDRSEIDTSTIILGIDKRNGNVITRSCENRGFGCLLFTDFYTIKYQNCDSVCCERSEGYWLVDYVGFAGTRSVVGCVPDTLQ